MSRGLAGQPGGATSWSAIEIARSWGPPLKGRVRSGFFSRYVGRAAWRGLRVRHYPEARAPLTG